MPAYSRAANEYRIEYTKFFAEYENIFLFRPNLVRDVFFSIVELKGNQKTARKVINSQVLGCHTNTSINQGCRIDQLRLERKKLGIPNYVTIPVNFMRVSTRVFNKRKKRMTLQWNPEILQPPTISVDEFLSYVTAARESRHYKVDPNIIEFQFNTLLERKIDIIVENELAANLLDLYQSPPADKQDAITFAFDFVSTSERFGTRDINIQLRAVAIRINQQRFKTVQLKR